MLESIFVGMSGLMGYSQGLRVIANNTANLNTPGFKGSSLQFADLFYASSEPSAGFGFGLGQTGYGLATSGSALNFKQGELRQTGNDLDLAVDGQGLFVLRNAEGEVHYTRAGQFEFNAEGVLVNRADQSKVMAASGTSNFAEISLSNLRSYAPKATTSVVFAGNLPPATSEQTVGNVVVVDTAGAQHTLNLRLARMGQEWTVTVLDGTTTVGTGRLVFENGQPTAATSKFTVNYAPAGLPEMPIELDFSNDVRSVESSSLAALAISRQNGVLAGALNKVTFNAKGALTLGYSNGQTIEGQRLALARFDSADAVTAVGDNQFRSSNDASWHVGVADAGGFGTVRAGSIEISNVDLSQQFSDLVIMQRGYQASSQVVSTANDMLQQLFSMKSR